MTYWLDWLALVTRWFHFMMGVAWIGASFYFIWLNNTVRPAATPRKPGLAGELWAVHGGAFYEVTKYAGAPETLPETLHWFKWEAYLTWISGFTLLVLGYWSRPSVYMIGPVPLTDLQAVGIGAAVVFGGWFVYDGLCRSPLRDRPVVFAPLLFGFILGVDYALSRVLSPHAAYVHVGAMIGTWMAANVLFVIIPGQRAMVDAMVRGEPPPVERGKAGALRSLHNNYLTLPVLFVMISSHFPQTFGHAQGWAILGAIGLVGAAYRHQVNRHEQGRPQPWIVPVAMVALVGVAFLARPVQVASASTVSSSQVHQVIANRCLGCHADQPWLAGFTAPPKGLSFDDPRVIAQKKELILQRVAVSKDMPLGNLTGMTDEERELVRAWAQ